MLFAIEYRGGFPDLHYRGHAAVTNADGKIIAAWGEPERVAFVRSAAKPMQAVPVIESGAAEEFDLSDAELAVICASHNGEETHIQAVASILRKAGLVSPLPLRHTCSGKHAGMLITAKKLGLNPDGYFLPGHPIQERITATIAELCDFPPEQIVMGSDGCGAVVHALPLQKFAQGFARMAVSQDFAIKRIIAAMCAAPLMLGGTGDFTSELNAQFGDRLFAKFGANGYFAVGLKQPGLGLAIKIESGNTEVLPPIVLSILEKLEVITPGEADLLPGHKSVKPITNHLGEVVGEVRAVALHRP